MVDVGTPGRQSDGTVFKNSNFGKKFERNLYDLPTPTELYKGGPVLPYFLIGDEAFGLNRYIQRPYPGRTSGRLGEGEQIFNYRLSRARRVIENSFGILSAKWRVFRQPIHANKEKVKYITLAAICLHNFILSEESDLQPHQRTYLHPTLVDREVNGKWIDGDWRTDEEPMHHNTFIDLSNDEQPEDVVPETTRLTAIRDELNEFFMTRGYVKWQFTQDIY